MTNNINPLIASSDNLPSDESDIFEEEYCHWHNFYRNLIESGECEDIDQFFGWLIKPAALYHMLRISQTSLREGDDNEISNIEMRRTHILESLIHFLETKAASYRILLMSREKIL